MDLSELIGKLPAAEQEEIRQRMRRDGAPADRFTRTGDFHTRVRQLPTVKATDAMVVAQLVGYVNHLARDDGVRAEIQRLEAKSPELQNRLERVQYIARRRLPPAVQVRGTNIQDALKTIDDFERAPQEFTQADYTAGMLAKQTAHENRLANARRRIDYVTVVSDIAAGAAAGDLQHAYDAFMTVTREFLRAELAWRDRNSICGYNYDVYENLTAYAQMQGE